MRSVNWHMPPSIWKQTAPIRLKLKTKSLLYDFPSEASSFVCFFLVLFETLFNVNYQNREYSQIQTLHLQRFFVVLSSFKHRLSFPFLKIIMLDSVFFALG